MKIIFRWRAELDHIMNIVKMTGVIKESSGIASSSLLLLQNALEMIEIAEYFGGILISAEPPKKDEEFVYFEVIFRDNTDCIDFLRAIANEPSE